ncbi:MAG TPA: ATP synthase F1 subunit epsilon [Bryobacteraceae bacterium]|nr:ATP synthase F1 subunit epsilon [Bryobacteraceae bacterium]
MADTFEIEIATPEKLVARQQAETAQIPGKDGYMGILPGHAPLLSELGIGELSITLGGQTDKYKITGGYVEVRDNHVRVLADRAE